MKRNLIVLSVLVVFMVVLSGCKSEQEKFAEIVENSKDKQKRVEALKQLEPQKWQDLLVQIGLNDNNSDIRFEAVKKITDQKVLGKIANNDLYSYIKNAAIAKITDQKILGEIAKKISVSSNLISIQISKGVGGSSRSAKNNLKNFYTVLIKITDKKVLTDIWKNHKDSLSRNVAHKKLINGSSIDYLYKDQIRRYQ